MAVQTTGYTNKTPLRYLLDAGAIYKGLTYDSATGAFTGTLLGATSGGNEFALEQTTRTIEVDGLKGAGVGNTVIDEESPTLTTNLKELTAENLALAIAGGQVDTADTNYDIITSKGRIDTADYLDNVGFVGRISGSNKPIVIIVENVISVEGISLKTQDKGEAVIPIKFQGHYDEGNVAAGAAPFKIYFPKEAAV
jgi:hypothetical protein